MSQIIGQAPDEFHTSIDCEGCGAKLQTKDKTTIGFIPKNRLESMIKDNLERKENLKTQGIGRDQKNNILYQLNKTFNGNIPSDIKEALEKEFVDETEDVNQAKPVVEYFQGEE